MSRSATRVAGIAAGALAFSVLRGMAPAQAEPPKPIDPNARFAARPHEPELDAAIQIARWLENTAVKLDDGWAWPAVPDDWAGRAVPKDSLDTSLYSGAAGIVLFGTQLALATGHSGPDGSRTKWLYARGSPFFELPDRAAAHLIATLPTKAEGEGCGLFTGIAGIGFALREWADATDHVEGGRAARRCVELLGKAARIAGTGIEWSDCTDVISGGAGIGLFLIYMAEVDEDPLAQELAIRAGRRLLDLSERESVGRSWRMDPTFARVMPNFSHGTAGVAFFLARLYELTGDSAYLDGALDGARHVLSLADTSDGGCRVFHHSNESDAKDDAEGRALHYLGWCHGPIGTAQLFMKLAQVSGDADWTDRALQCAKAVRDSGIPERTTPGFWDNVGLCCGTAGVANFFATVAWSKWRPSDLMTMLSYAPAAEGEPDREFARHCLDGTLAKGVRDDGGLRFPQAEHRVKPDLVQAQVGLMQGAAGIGLVALRLSPPSEGFSRVADEDPLGPLWRIGGLRNFNPVVPAAEPTAATLRFENLGRAVLFAGSATLLRDGPLNEVPPGLAPPSSLACDEMLDAVLSAKAKLVLLHVQSSFGERKVVPRRDSGAYDYRIGDDVVEAFVAGARRRGLAVGLSLSLRAPTEGTSSEWEVAERQTTELLRRFGPLVVLRIEHPAGASHRDRFDRGLIYRSAKSVAPQTLIEFVPPFVPGSQSLANNAIGTTDVVAAEDVDPDEAGGDAMLRPAHSSATASDGPWHVVDGRRRYLPLQIELPLGRIVQGASRSRSTEPNDSELRDFGAKLVDAAVRARNVLVIARFEQDGSISPATLDQLRELGQQ